MITIYKKDEADFTHRGLGTLPDATEAEVQEIINGIFDLRVTYPKDGRKADLLQEERIIKASTPKGDQLFRIYKIRKDLPYIEAHALHKFYDLSDNFIEDSFIQNKGGQAALQQLLDMSILPHDFTCTSDVPGPMNLRIVRYNTVAAIMGDEEENTLLKRGGGEIERDNHIIRWKKRLGEDRGVKIKYRKNLLGLDFESDYSPVVTRIMPQGFDGLFLPEKYVDSPRINDYHMPKIQKREYPVISAEKNPDEEGAIPHDEALAKLRTLAAEEFSNGLDLPTISCFVDFIDLAQTAEYKEYQVLERIYIGDTIHVIYPEQNIELSARMTMYTWDALKHRYNSMFVGTMKNELQSSISAGEKALVKAEEVQQSMMEKAREVATALINSGFGGHVRIHPDKVLIMDTEDESTAQKVWQWNLNGLGYSSTGINGPYTTAMVDGQILGERITAGSITVNQVAADFGQSLDISSNTSINQAVKDVFNGEIMTVSATAPESPTTGRLWLDTSVSPNLIKRWDGSEWVTVSDTTQLEELVASKASQEDLDGQIASVVASIQASLESEISQTQETINFKFSEALTAIDEAGQRITDLSTEIETNIRFTAEGIELGKSDNPVSVKILPDRVSFSEGGQEVAYFSNNKLYVTDIHVLTSLRIGNFAFFPRSSGNLSFKKVT